MVKLLFPALFIALLAPTASPISLHLLPRIAMAPATVRITVKVEPNEYNRGMHLAIDSGEYYRAWFDPDFEGLNGAKIRSYNYEFRAPGVYTVTAIIKRTLPESDKQTHDEFCLAGPGVTC